MMLKVGANPAGGPGITESDHQRVADELNHHIKIGRCFEAVAFLPGGDITATQTGLWVQHLKCEVLA